MEHPVKTETGSEVKKIIILTTNLGTKISRISIFVPINGTTKLGQNLFFHFTIRTTYARTRKG